VLEPQENEVRFTRSRQALPWFAIATICCVAICSFLTAILLPLPYGAPELIDKWFLFLPALPIGCLSMYLALRCLRHAYIIFSGVGIEIFPFWKPKKNLNIIPWQTIHELEIKNHLLYVHHNAEHTAGVVLSLKPIHQNQIPFLKHIIEKRSASISEQRSSEEK